jgi:addiction module HigA family antidote
LRASSRSFFKIKEYCVFAERSKKMTQLKKFCPGYYLQQDLDALELTPKEFSQRSGISEEQVLGILKGSVPLDPSLADKLSAFFGSSPSLWLGLQKDYEAYQR